MAKTEKKLIANNKKAYHDYFLEERFEAGIELHGTEVKSMRKCSIKEAFVRIENGEVIVYGMHVSPYEKGNIFNKDPLRPKKLLMHKSEIRKLTGKLAEQGYTLCIIDCGADHADLTDEYGSITRELGEIASALGAQYLCEAGEEKFYSSISGLRRIAGDRAVLRAMHIFEEDKRAGLQASALKEGDFGAFLRLVYESGLSSWRFLQNVVPCVAVWHQELAFALGLCEKLLGGNGVCRVHGGGFAGTLQAFVRLDALSGFRQDVEAELGQGACRVMDFRSRGACKLDI